MNKKKFVIVTETIDTIFWFIIFSNWIVLTRKMVAKFAGT